MNTTQNRICAMVVSIGALGLLITSLAPRAKSAGGAVAVQVTGNVSTRNVDNAALQPFGMRVYPSVNNPTTFTVPAGKRLVITDVTGFTFSGTAWDVQISTSVNGSYSTIEIPFSVTSNQKRFAIGHFTVTADPGTVVQFDLEDANSSDTFGMNVDIHGYYVNYP